MSFVSGPDSVSIARAVSGAIANGAGQLRPRVWIAAFEVVMTSRWRNLKAGPPALAPVRRGRPRHPAKMRCSVSSCDDGVEVERRVEVVPPKYFKGGQVIPALERFEK